MDRSLWRRGIKPILRPGQALAQAFKRALDFNGRSRRSAYWWFALFAALGGAACGIVDEYVHVPGLEDWSVFFLLFCTIVVLPDLSLGMRRLHDTGRKGWLYVGWIIVSYGSIILPEPDFEYNIVEGESVEFWDLMGYDLIYSIFTGLIFFGLLILMIALLTRDSQRGPNRYGPNPKNIGNPDIFS